MTDEVYEHLTYDGVAHVPLATLPGMAERTLTLSSAGKSLSFTGWKVGWAGFGNRKRKPPAILARWGPRSRRWTLRRSHSLRTNNCLPWPSLSERSSGRRGRTLPAA